MTSPAEGTDGLATVARGGTANLGGALVSGIASLALTVIVTRFYSPSAAGAFFVAMSVFLIAEAVANLGAYNGAIYFIARLGALRAAPGGTPAITRMAVIPVVFSSMLTAAGVIEFAGPLARLMLDGRAADGVSPAAVAAALRTLAIALPFAALADTLLGAARGYQRMRPTVLVDRVCRPLLQATGVLAAALAGSSVLLAPGWAVPYAGAGIAAAFWLRTITRSHQHQPPTAIQRREGGSAPDLAAAGRGERKPTARQFWRFTGPRSVAGVAQIGMQRLDIVLAGVMAGPAGAAVYTAATRFLVAGQLAGAAIGMAAQPQFTRLFATGDRDRANAVYQATTCWLILLAWPLYLLAAIFGPVVLAVFGRGYGSGGTVMLILALTMLAATACGQVDVVLIATGRSGWSLLNELLALSVNVGIDLVLIPADGISGAAIGWAAAIGITNLAPLLEVALAAKVHPFGPGTAAACLLTTVSFAVIPLGARALGGDSAAVSIIAIAAGCAVMAAGLWALRGVLRLAAIGRSDWQITIPRELGSE